MSIFVPKMIYYDKAKVHSYIAEPLVFITSIKTHKNSILFLSHVIRVIVLNDTFQFF